MNFHSIFELQAQLMDKYYDIENEVCSGVQYPRRLVHEYEFQDVHVQAHIRVTVTRILEELFEASQEKVGSDSFKEEIIDSLHFFTELLLFCGITVEDVGLTCEEDLDEYFKFHRIMPKMWAFNYGMVNHHLFEAVHMLKAKPWSHKQKVTDVAKLKAKLSVAYQEMVLLVSRQMTYDECMNTYLGKHKVNTERQENGY